MIRTPQVRTETEWEKTRRLLLPGSKLPVGITANYRGWIHRSKASMREEGNRFWAEKHLLKQNSINLLSTFPANSHSSLGRGLKSPGCQHQLEQLRLRDAHFESRTLVIHQWTWRKQASTMKWWVKLKYAGFYSTSCPVYHVEGSSAVSPPA